MKRPGVYLKHMLASIDEILDYTREGAEAFFASTLIQDAVLRKLQVLAQSTINLPEELVAQHPEIDWRSIRGFRNLLVHAYLDVELPEVWAVVEQDLPELREAVQSLTAGLDRSN